MGKRLAAGLVAGATAVLVTMPLAGTAAACTDTLQSVITTTDCPSNPCPPPTRPRAAVDLDGYTITVCV